MELLGQIEEVGNEDGKPSKEVLLADCGVCAGVEEVQAILDENKQQLISAAAAEA